VRLDEAVVERIDEMRQPLRMTRSGWLRKAVARNLECSLEHDISVVVPRDIQLLSTPEGL